MTCKKSAYILLPLVCLFVVTCSKDETDTSLNSTDIDFIKQATLANLNELRLSAIAHYNGHENRVIFFADQASLDDSIATASMDSLVNALPYSGDRPLEPDSLHQAQTTFLWTLYGYTFDTAYINQQILDHQAIIPIYETEIAKGRSPLVKHYASRYLPLVQAHLNESLSIQEMLK